MKIAICDDEREIRELIKGYICSLYPDSTITQYISGEELLSDDSLADIIFLDIQMNGIDGMEVARILRKRNIKSIIIFVTAIEEYVFQAFDVGAFHYLIKPFDKVRFFQVLKAAVQQYKEECNKSHIEEKYIIIKTGRNHVKVYINEIIYAEVFNRKIIIHMIDDKLEYYGKMIELEKQVGDDFMRSHRAYLINFRHVIKYDSSSITLEGGNNALMAKQNYSEFIKRYLKYIQKEGNM